MAAPRGGGDAGVQGTNDDAQASKLSAINFGYIADPFLRHFVRRPSRRSPLIHRGYYARMAALRKLLAQFLATEPHAPKQILSLGAGYDTLYFQLHAAQSKPKGPPPPVRVFEVDFPAVTQRKAAIIAATPALAQHLEDAEELNPGTGRIRAPFYALLPADLRELGVLDVELRSAGFNPQVPTCVVAECVLVYMAPAESTALLAWLATRLPTAACLIYEQIRPDDQFGKQMLKNLEARGCPLRGLPAVPDCAAQVARLRGAGWQRAEARDMDAVYRDFLPAADRARAERLELFDEFEEWHMIQEHYCIAIGVNNAKGVLGDYGLQDAHDKDSVD